MSIYNTIASLVGGGGGGLEYEEGTFELSTAKVSKIIYFANTHTKAPAVVMAECTDSTSGSYTTFTMCIVYGYLFGTERGGSSSYYAQKISGRGTTTSMTVNGSYTTSTMDSNNIKPDLVQIIGPSSYPMAAGSWKWIAIWK